MEVIRLQLPKVRARGWRTAILVLILLESVPISGALEVCFEDELRHASATLAGQLVSLAGVPVAREGTTLMGPSFRLEVYPPCSGGRVLAAVIAFGCAAVAASRACRARRVLVLLALVPAGLAANALRVAIMFSTRATDPDTHSMLGLLCFSVVALAVAYAAGLAIKEVKPPCAC